MKAIERKCPYKAGEKYWIKVNGVADKYLLYKVIYKEEVKRLPRSKRYKSTELYFVEVKGMRDDPHFFETYADDCAAFKSKKELIKFYDNDND